MKYIKRIPYKAPERKFKIGQRVYYEGQPYTVTRWESDIKIWLRRVGYAHDVWIDPDCLSAE